MTVIERFWSKVDTSGDCWPWTAGLNGGYGQIRISALQGMISAHRLSALIHFGAFDKRTFVLHRCDEPRCVNPDHLYLGDHAHNMRDRAQRKRSFNPNGGMTACRKGHPFDDANTYWRPDRPNSRTCRACNAEGARQKRLVP